MESCAYCIVNSESTAFGPSYDYPGDEYLLQLKECTRDVRAHLASFVFSAKKIDVQVMISVNFFLTYSDTEPGTSTFSQTSIHNHHHKTCFRD